MERLGFKSVATPAAYLFLIVVIIGFAHSSLQSNTGLAAFREAGSEERRLSAELARLTAERERVANKVHRLSDTYLDLDLLDERARDVLGLVRIDEMIVR